jgi:hypothetical protein
MMMIEIFILLGLLILFIGMIAGGIYCLIKYKKTKEKKYLIIGLILTLIVIGVLIYVFIIIPMTMVSYGPPEMMR